MTSSLPPNWPTIEGKPLTEYDIGLRVLYQPYRDGPFQEGTISSFREDGGIFVRFNGPTGERTPSTKLFWPTQETTA